MSRWLFLFCLAIPATLIAEALHATPIVIFVLAALGIIPLAGLIGLATEVLAARLGQRIGGLLNATFGNAAEIIIGLAALTTGLPEVVRASLAGSIVGNILLVLGTSMFVGGWKYRIQRFDRRGAGQYAAMLVLAVIGMAIPTLLATVGENTQSGTAIVQGDQLHKLSICIAVILLLCYAAYIASSVFRLRAPVETSPPGDKLTSASPAPRSLPDTEPRQRQSSGINLRLVEQWRGTLWLPIAVLTIATVFTAIMSEILVGTIEPLTQQIGLNPFFVGLIVLPVIGNAAEYFSSITAAAHNHMETSLAITAGSSIQIAFLVTPILVIAGALLGKPLDLNFSLLEIALFGLVAGLYALISLDGESTWLEGLLLCAFYLILACGTFFLPI